MLYEKKIANKEQNTIKDIVKRMFGYNLKEVSDGFFHF